MNKDKFLSELSRRLRGLPKDDFDDAMNYYIEYFLDAGVDNTQDVTQLVGTPDIVARRILDECTDKVVTKSTEEGGVKNSTRAIWYILLGIFAAPIAFPLALALAIVFFAVIFVIIAVVIALVASSVGVVIAGIAAIPAIFWAETGSQAMVLMGMACVGVSFGVLMTIAFIKLGELIVKLLIRFFRFISKKREESRRKKEQDVANAGFQNAGPGSAVKGGNQ